MLMTATPHRLRRPLPDSGELYRALLARDPSYEGIFIAGVRTTGIFCRPTCPAKKPRPENVEFFATTGEAAQAGYRPCRRCKPLERSGTHPEWVRRILDLLDENPAARLTDAAIKRLGAPPPARGRRAPAAPRRAPAPPRPPPGGAPPLFRQELRHDLAGIRPRPAPGDRPRRAHAGDAGVAGGIRERLRVGQRIPRRVQAAVRRHPHRSPGHAADRGHAGREPARPAARGRDRRGPLHGGVRRPEAAP